MDGLTLPMFPVNCLRREVSDTPLAVTRRVKGTTLPFFKPNRSMFLTTPRESKEIARTCLLISLVSRMPTVFVRLRT